MSKIHQATACSWLVDNSKSAVVLIIASLKANESRSCMELKLSEITEGLGKTLDTRLGYARSLKP